ncbi:hypothetical protein ABZW18_21260 [Streptomyces sp. NPDC004647]|uniref:hypothetical protein n=1 Tax=Streptomyces sp. NPDC004647 TaxID=3154671 RepID=UPI0033B49C21
MAVHYTTFVLQASVSLPDDTPVLVLGADTAEEIPGIPLVTSLHRIDNAVMPFSHAAMVLGEFPVSDAWIEAVQGYDSAAKVVIIREPVPAGASTEDVFVAEGVRGESLPPWVGPLVAQKLHAAMRDVPVTYGEDPLSIGIVPSAPTSFPAWAHRIITPAA